MTTPENKQEKTHGRRQTIEQERARVAWANVEEVKETTGKDSETFKQEYRSIARGLNAMIQINGLGQTLGFFLAKGKGDKTKAHYVLLKHLTGWMEVESHFKASNRTTIAEKKDGHLEDGLLRWVIAAETSSSDYRRATAECLAFGSWLRRFAEAELEPEKKKAPTNKETQSSQGGTSRD